MKIKGVKMNFAIRKFQDDLVDLINANSDIPIEARLVALELVTSNVQKMADDAIISEMSEKEEQCKNPIPE